MFELFKELIDFTLNGGSLDFRRGSGTVIPITPPVQARSSRRILIEKNTEPYWRERGWVQNANEFVGYYQTRFGVHEGKISASPAGYCKIYINDPPQSVRKHPKWVCFHYSHGKWYRVHTVIECRDVSSAILQIENILFESHEEYH